MKSNSYEKKYDSMQAAQILQGFCQSAFIDTKAQNKTCNVSNKPSESKKVETMNEPKISQILCNLNDKNICCHSSFASVEKTMEPTHENKISHAYLPYSHFIDPRTVTPVSTPLCRYTKEWVTIVGNPQNTTPLVPPKFKSGDQGSKEKEMLCLEHIVHFPNHSIKTTSPFNVKDFNHDTANVSRLQHNASPWPRIQDPAHSNMSPWTLPVPQTFGNHVIAAKDDPLITYFTKSALCRMKDCQETAGRRTPYCDKHSGVRRCEHPICNKYAQGQTRFCIAHGGGRRCCFPGCAKAARDRNFCAAHGGGRRCDEVGCTKIAVGRSKKCTAHGGGRRCQFQECGKAAQSSSNFCVRHGGGKKCVVKGCCKVARGRTSMCMAHGRITASQEKLP